MGEPGNARDAAMDESFEDRVKRLFGSDLFKAVPESSFPASSWSVGKVERQEWNHERGVREEWEDDPCSSAFYDKDGCLLKSRRSRKTDKQREFEGDLDDPYGDEEGDEEKKGMSEEEEIWFWIGQDPTLDNEEEDDKYDRENANECVYMKDVKDHGPYMNYHVVVPDFLDEPSDDFSFYSTEAASIKVLDIVTFRRQLHRH